MKKLILGFMVMCFLFISCAGEAQREIMHTGTVNTITYIHTTFLEGSHYVVEFESGILVKIGTDTKGDLPEIDAYFNIVRYHRPSFIFYRLERIPNENPNT